MTLLTTHDAYQAGLNDFLLASAKAHQARIAIEAQQADELARLWERMLHAPGSSAAFDQVAAAEAATAAGELIARHTQQARQLRIDVLRDEFTRLYEDRVLAGELLPPRGASATGSQENP